MVNNTEQAQFLEELLDRAKSGEHSDFIFLTCLTDLTAARLYRRAIKKVLNGFINASNRTYRAYLETVKRDINGLDLLLSYKELQSVIAYYTVEYDISCDTIDEYRSYALSGHIIDILIGNERAEEDLYDFRYSYKDDKNDL